MLQLPQQLLPLNNSNINNNSLILVIPVNQVNNQPQAPAPMNQQGINFSNINTIYNSNLNSNNLLNRINTRNMMASQSQNEIDNNIETLLNTIIQQNQQQQNTTIQYPNTIESTNISNIFTPQSNVSNVSNVSNISPQQFIQSTKLLPQLNGTTNQNLFTQSVLVNSIVQNKKHQKQKSPTVPPIKESINTNGLQKKHKCNVCFKSFNHKWEMVKHKVIHSGVRPHVCTICNTSYGNKSAQINHMKKSHPMVWETIKHRYLSK